MKFELLIALRYLRSKQKERFISLITAISIAGVALGVAALLVVLAVMSGFDREVREKIIGTYSHIVISEEGNIADMDYVISQVSGAKDVVSFAPFVSRQAILKAGGDITGVLIRGIDPVKEPTVTNISEFTGKKNLDFGKNSIILGNELKRRLSLSLGDTVSIMLPQKLKPRPFKVTGEFNSGYYTYDANMAIMSIDSAKKLFGDDCVNGVGLKIRNEFAAESVKNALKKKLGFPFVVRTWMEYDKNLMRALAIEKKLMFVILGIMVVVACFNIASTLVMVVMEKTRDIGILKAIGATSASIRRIFLIHGFLIALAGIALGNLAGLAVASRINEIAGSVERLTGFSLFPNDIYYLSEIPVRVEMADALSIAAIAFVVSIAASFYPALRASRLDPMKAIRYE